VTREYTVQASRAIVVAIDAIIAAGAPERLVVRPRPQVKQPLQLPLPITHT
jgi:hypothetical protein